MTRRHLLLTLLLLCGLTALVLSVARDTNGAASSAQQLFAPRQSDLQAQPADTSWSRVGDDHRRDHGAPVPAPRLLLVGTALAGFALSLLALRRTSVVQRRRPPLALWSPAGSRAPPFLSA